MNIYLKYLLACTLLLMGLYAYSGEYHSNDFSPEGTGYTDLTPEKRKSLPPAADAEFERLAEQHGILTRTIEKVPGVQAGFYIISGVFSKAENARRMRHSMLSAGLTPSTVFNPANKLYYVSLQHHKTGISAIKASTGAVKKLYSGKTWILQVARNIQETIEPVGHGDATSKAELELFRSAAKKSKIAHRTSAEITSIEQGYYLIAGVYGNKENAEKRKTVLRSKGLTAEVLYNSLNTMHYLSLYRSDRWEDALRAAGDRVSGKYSDKLWILGITGPENPVKESRPQSVARSVSREDQNKTFYALARDKGIPTRTDSDFSSLEDGFYLVAGVFGDNHNANSYVQRLQRTIPGALAAIHPKSGLNYVCLKHYEKGSDVIDDYTSALDGLYTDPLWILHVDRPDTRLAKSVLPPENRPVISAQQMGERSRIMDLARPYSNDKLLEKADLYFDKMWYAEAAELYEKVLNESPENHTFDIIRKAGDAHYFNTNMERAYYWYDLLYTKYKSDMRAENLFKYAHSLKGTGKYGRAKRLMKLYNKALKTEGVRTYRPRPGNAVLDNILNTEAIDVNINNIAVNSEYSDFSPMFYQEDRLVFASAMDSAFFNTRRYKWNNQPYLDLYVAKLNEQSNEVRDAVKFSKKINTKYHEAAVTFAPDQQTIYFTRNNYGKKLKRDKKGVNHLKIYMSRKTEEGWSEAVELPFNSDEYSTGHPALSPDGTKLYFVSDMPGSIGKTDLFVVDVLGDGQFSSPRNLGPEINTESREMFPFVSNEKLYFASDGHVGLGGLDIYELDITDEGFSEPRNLGKPINSKRDDFSYIIKEETQKGFFSSNRRGGKGDDDIYSFKRLIPEEPNENAIAGVVTELVTGEVMPTAMVELLDENNVKLMEVEADADGSFVFEELEGNTRYVIRTTVEGYTQDEQIVSTEDNKRIEMEVKMQQLEERIVLEDGIRKLKMDMIYFDFDKFNIRSDAAEELDKLVGVMNTYPEMVIKIESHTDSRGKRAYNKYLSDKRAKSTREYLIARGIDPRRIESAIGYGEERLLNECDGTVRCSSAKHQLNRRSEFIIVSM